MAAEAELLSPVALAAPVLVFQFSLVELAAVAQPSQALEPHAAVAAARRGLGVRIAIPLHPELVQARLSASPYFV